MTVVGYIGYKHLQSGVVCLLGRKSREKFVDYFETVFQAGDILKKQMYLASGEVSVPFLMEKSILTKVRLRVAQQIVGL